MHAANLAPSAAVASRSLRPSSACRLLLRLAAFALLVAAVCSSGLAWAQAPTRLALAASAPAVAESSSQPGVVPETAPAHVAAVTLPPMAHRPGTRVRPFHGLAIATRNGTGGLGGDLATPLAGWLNLRAGVQMYEQVANLTTYGMQVQGDLTLGGISTSLDIFPFHNSLHISPGFTLRNDNHMSAAILVPAGSTITLGNADYTSAPGDPLHGVARLVMGDSIAPRLTVGVGNMLKPRGGHWSMPFEVGLQYTSPPTLWMDFAGSACDAQMQCGDINQGDGQQNIAAQVRQIEQDIQPLRFYPIVSFGLSYRFGHNPAPVR